MNASQHSQQSAVIPTLRYRDGQAAIEWLCKAFGFEKNLVVPDKTGAIAHAQLTFGNGMIMLGSADNNDLSKLVKSPAESGGIGSQSVYIVVPDVDAHHAKAVKPERKSSSPSRMKTTAAAFTHAAIGKVMSGTSAVTTLGRNTDRAMRQALTTSRRMNDAMGLFGHH